MGKFWRTAISDLNAATRWLSSVGNYIFVSVIVLGFGAEHDRAVTSWQQIAETHSHVRVESANASTDAEAIAERLLAMGQ